MQAHQYWLAWSATDHSHDGAALCALYLHPAFPAVSVITAAQQLMVSAWGLLPTVCVGGKTLVPDVCPMTCRQCPPSLPGCMACLKAECDRPADGWAYNASLPLAPGKSCEHPLHLTVQPHCASHPLHLLFLQPHWASHWASGNTCCMHVPKLLQILQLVASPQSYPCVLLQYLWTHASSGPSRR